MTWTPTQLHELHRLYTVEGLSAADIAKRLRTTKNAVIGKANRKGWKRQGWNGLVKIPEVNIEVVIAEVLRAYPRSRFFLGRCRPSEADIVVAYLIHRVGHPADVSAARLGTHKQKIYRAIRRCRDKMENNWFREAVEQIEHNLRCAPDPPPPPPPAPVPTNEPETQIKDGQCPHEGRWLRPYKYCHGCAPSRKSKRADMTDSIGGLGASSLGF